MSKVYPFLWFENANAFDVVEYYRNIFGKENVQVENEESYSDTPSGEINILNISIFGTKIGLMGADKHDSFNDSISFIIDCSDQEEIDKYWDLITQEGEESQCGWCRDKYGLRWQVVPVNIDKLISKPESFKKMLEMKKIIIDELG